jgi:uncharacterized protein (DUF486 family)
VSADFSTLCLKEPSGWNHVVGDRADLIAGGADLIFREW